MISLNLNRIFKAKGIDKPFSFLVRNGFSDNFATRVTNNRAKRIGLEQLSQLCVILHCTPNDLLDWDPNSKFEVDKEHPLHSLTKPDKVVDIKKTLNSIPLDKIYEIDQLINDRINRK